MLNRTRELFKCFNDTSTHLSGQLMSFLVSAQVIQRSLTSLSVLFGAGVRGAAAGSRVFEFLNMFPKFVYIL